MSDQKYFIIYLDATQKHLVAHILSKTEFTKAETCPEKFVVPLEITDHNLRKVFILSTPSEDNKTLELITVIDLVDPNQPVPPGSKTASEYMTTFYDHPEDLFTAIIEAISLHKSHPSTKFH